MRLIDADALDMYECLKSYYGDAWRDAQEVIDNAPTIDAVQVVRCKDCIYYHPFAEIKGKGECHIIEDAEYFPWYEDCDYCSYGERRDKDETH